MDSLNRYKVTNIGVTGKLKCNDDCSNELKKDEALENWLYAINTKCHKVNELFREISKFVTEESSRELKGKLKEINEEINQEIKMILDYANLNKIDIARYVRKFEIDIGLAKNALELFNVTFEREQENEKV